MNGSATPMASGKTRSISVEAWHKLALEGSDLPIRICLNGDSMRPLIRRGIDPVTIVPLRRPPRPGDVVLFADDAGRYVVHRVYRCAGEWIITMGDHCVRPDHPLKREQLWGLVVKAERGRRTIGLDSAAARLWGRLWMHLLPLRRIYYRIRNLQIRRELEHAGK